MNGSACLVLLAPNRSNRVHPHSCPVKTISDPPRVVNPWNKQQNAQAPKADEAIGSLRSPENESSHQKCDPCMSPGAARICEPRPDHSILFCFIHSLAPSMRSPADQNTDRQGISCPPTRMRGAREILSNLLQAVRGRLEGGPE